MRDARSEGVVVGLSGGVDSAATAALSAHALGPKRVVGVFMFEEENQDYRDARYLAKLLNMRTLDFSIRPLLRAFQRAAGNKYDRVTFGNVKARLRMTILYSVANRLNLLVAGTGDRSEDILGYFTKYGDGGVDLLPIAHLYKSQVRELARYLHVPEVICCKPSSPNLWKGHTATDELPADYEVLDPVLYHLFTKRTSPSILIRGKIASRHMIESILKMHHHSNHKREYPPMIESW